MRFYVPSGLFRGWRNELYGEIPCAAASLLDFELPLSLERRRQMFLTFSFPHCTPLSQCYFMLLFGRFENGHFGSIEDRRVPTT